MMKRTPDLTAIFQVETWLASCPTEGRRYVTTLANLGKLFTPVCLEADRLHYPRESFRGGLWNHRRTFVSLSVTTITKQNVDGSGRNFFGKVPRRKSKPKFACAYVTIASRVWILLSKNAVNRGFFPM